MSESSKCVGCPLEKLNGIAGFFSHRCEQQGCSIQPVDGIRKPLTSFGKSSLQQPDGFAQRFDASKHLAATVEASVDVEQRLESGGKLLSAFTTKRRSGHLQLGVESA